MIKLGAHEGSNQMYCYETMFECSWKPPGDGQRPSLVEIVYYDSKVQIFVTDTTQDGRSSRWQQCTPGITHYKTKSC